MTNNFSINYPVIGPTSSWLLPLTIAQVRVDSGHFQQQKSDQRIWEFKLGKSLIVHVHTTIDFD